MYPFIKSLQIGKVQQFGNKDKKGFFERSWKSGSFKGVVTEGIVTTLGIVGDEVSDTESHGGLEKAIFANSYANYPLWSDFLGINELPFGALAENITVSGLDETTVFLGDIHQIGEVILQVSQPRKPCWKISRKWQNKDFTKEIFTSGRTGWYYQVLQTGKIAKNDTIIISHNDGKKISIMEANQAFREPRIYQKLLQEILLIPNISTSYKESIDKRIKGNYNLEFMEVV